MSGESSVAATTYDQLMRLLADHGARYRLIDHTPEGRTEIVSRLRGHDPRLAAKCMILMVKRGRRERKHVLAVVPGDRRVSLEAVKALYQASYVSFASPDVAERLAGSVAGTVLPFALSGELELVVDPSLADSEEIFFNAARLDRSLALRTEDYLAIAKPRMASVAGPPDAGSHSQLLAQAAAHAERYLALIPERHAGPVLSGDALRDLLRCPLSEPGEDPRLVIDQLAEAGLGGTAASQGPRYFGFVNGGSLPVATAADWLVSAWDQNAQVFVMSPIASVVEEIAAGWLKQLFGLPSEWSVGFVTGAQMATFTGLLIARHHLLAQAGWDVEREGLFGAPPIDVIISDESHRTILTALRMLGLGEARLRRVDTDSQGRMRADRLALALKSAGKACVVCAQAGNVNTGATDPLAAIAGLTREHGAWLHVDGAFGLWAAASPAHREQVAGVELADSIAADGHKWLNVPYDSGFAFTAHPEAHRRALMIPAHYIQLTPGERDPRAFTPDESRRARGVAVYAALRTLGRQGVADMVTRFCAHARRMADSLGRHPQVRVLNEVVLNQVLVQFLPSPGDSRDAAAFTDRVVAGIQQEGTCWLGPTVWHGLRAVRISICNWSTTERDIDWSAAAILAVLEQTIAQA